MEELIEQYRDVPYFNNKTLLHRASLRVHSGKGSIKEIRDEIEEIGQKEKINTKGLEGNELKKILVDHNIGIDCSGFAYYLLDNEMIKRGKGSLKGHLKFPYSHGVIGRLRSALRPIENIDVKTLAHNENSRVINLNEVKVGDMITMIGNDESLFRDHILIVYRIDFENDLPKTIYYAHAIAWPSDGEYGHGIHKGKIEILDINKSLLDQTWVELEKRISENYTYTRAKVSNTELRRLNYF